MSNLNFIEINDEVINVDYITKISYDELLDKYLICIKDEPVIKIDKDQYFEIISHLKSISNSFVVF